MKYWKNWYGLVLAASSHTAPASVLPNLVPSALVTSGDVSPKAWVSRRRRMRSTPSVMLPHWSLPAHLQAAAVAVEQLQEVPGLQQHVAELGEGDPLLPGLQAGAHRVLADHLVDRELLADVAEKIEEGDRGQPGGVVLEDGAGAAEVDEAFELGLDARLVVRPGPRG